MPSILLTPPPLEPLILVQAVNRAHEALAEAAARHLVPIAIADAAPGDVLLFRWRPHLPAKHAAILVTDDRIVHAHARAAVAEVSFARFWQRRLAFAFKFPGNGCLGGLPETRVNAPLTAISR